MSFFTNYSRQILLIVFIVIIAVAIYSLESSKNTISKDVLRQATIPVTDKSVSESGAASEKLSKYPRAKEIVKPSGFLNTNDNQITIKELIGKKVILIDFWTYSCINCQRTLPYITGWYDKYRNHGLEIIGVHTPEFDFEKVKDNVAKAIQRFGIKYPVVQDNDYGTWRAYGNRYWPRKYLIDIDGYIVYDHIGEGSYSETEMEIQDLLQERVKKLSLKDDLIPTDIYVPSTTERKRTGSISPEIYFGAFRNQRLANGIVGLVGKQTFVEPAKAEENKLYFSGEWDISGESAKNVSSNGKIIFRYRANDVYMVLDAENPVKVKVLRDGKLLTDLAGDDVDGNSIMTVDDERLYKIISGDSNAENHLLEFVIEGTGVRAYTFTFG